MVAPQRQQEGNAAFSRGRRSRATVNYCEAVALLERDFSDATEAQQVEQEAERRKCHLNLAAVYLQVQSAVCS